MSAVDYTKSIKEPVDGVKLSSLLKSGSLHRTVLLVCKQGAAGRHIYRIWRSRPKSIKLHFSRQRTDWISEKFVT